CHDDIEFVRLKVDVIVTSTLSRTNSAAMSGEALFAPLGPAILDRKVAAVGPAEFTQSLHERGGPFAAGRPRALAHETDGRQLPPLLRARRERPGRRDAEQRNELAAPDHSITSSARARSIGLYIQSPALIDSALCCLVLCETSSRGRLTKNASSTRLSLLSILCGPSKL